MTTINLDELRNSGTVETSDARLDIEMGERPLPLGEHRFNLQVFDNSGNQSTAAIVSVFIIDTQAPTAILRVLNNQGQPVNRIAFGDNFTLDASLSTDAGGGVIDRYVWRMVNLDDNQ
ncbi:hypothetical protein P886_1717 [Alteromonadaceae bacterium 2753L.S.0a.02]|nr:hypothetical protein P886_1717 [Alteromonadaceae bacterium 2753L.S.0a.02]